MIEKSILSVSQLNEYLRMMMDGDRVLSSILIRGEISNFKLYSSGHAYFTLKDEEGQLKAVMFRSYAARLAFMPADGMRVIVHGRISVYGASGQYQLYADEMQPDGAGSLALRYEQLKRKLETEGLFDLSHKKPLPQFPRRVGVITSPTGAAVHDMINVLGRRFPLAEMILYPSMVQGAEAPLQLISGIEFFGATGLVDVIIIGRGGGSAEDLWAFNDEHLARSIFACPIPVISAVGHESDFTICDFVADQRAPTPSAAAELAVPDAREWIGHFFAVGERIRALTESSIVQNKRYLNQLTASRVMQRPEQVLAPFYLKVSALEQGLEHAAERALREKQQALARIGAKMEALNPLSVLSRGYAAVSNGDGKAVTRAADTKQGELLSIRFSDGSILAEVTKGIEDGK